jgi:AcrR family transcriptional regulator
VKAGSPAKSGAAKSGAAKSGAAESGAPRSGAAKSRTAAKGRDSVASGTRRHPRSGRAGGRRREAPYHHGALRAAMLGAAERILERDGIQGLTLRAAAREAGVSHAAPKNHFGDVRGLLSELAAVGFARFVAALVANVRDGDPRSARMAAIGRGYVAFARQNPGLFLLMFRGERLDFSRPALREAANSAFAVLARGAGAGDKPDAARLSVPQAARIAAAWSLVHGFAMLMLDGRLKPVIGMVEDGIDEMELLSAVLGEAKP